MGGAVGACISHSRPSRPLRTCCLLEALLDKLGPLLTRHFASSGGPQRCIRCLAGEAQQTTDHGGRRPAAHIGLMPPCAKAIAAALSKSRRTLSRSWII